MNGTLELLTLVIYSIGCIGFGALGLRLMGWRSERYVAVSPLALLASAFLMGQGLLALLLNVLGVFALLKSWVIWFVLVAGSLPALFIWDVARKLPAQLRQVLSDLKNETWGWLALPLLVGFTVLLHASLCTIPLTGWDAANIYMAEGKLMASTERLISVPGLDDRLKAGLVGEVHFGAFMRLGTGTQTPRLFTLLITLAMAILLAGIARKIGMGRRGQWITVSLMFTSSVVTNVISDGKVDLYAAALGVAAFYWASQYGSQSINDQSILRIIAVLASLTVLAKTTYAICLILPIVILVTWRNLTVWPPKNLSQAIRQLIPIWFNLGIWMLIVQLPHFFKSAAVFSEPLAPFFGQTRDFWLQQTWMSAENVQRLLRVYPLAVVLADYPDPISQFGRLSFAVLIFLPLGILLPRPKRIFESLVFQLTICAILGIILWVMMRPSFFATRYFMALLLILTLFPAKAAEAASYRYKWPLRMNWLVLATLLFTFYAYLYWDFTSYFPLNVAKERLPNYVAAFFEQNDLRGCDPANAHLCQWAEFLNSNAMPGERVFTAGLPSAPVFWLRSDLMLCMRGIDERMAMGQDLAQNWNNLAEHGFTWLVLWKRDPKTKQVFIQPGRMPEWIEATLVLEIGEQEIYRIQNHSSTIRSAWACKQTDALVWKAEPTNP